MSDVKPAIRYLPAASRTATPWKNGGGITREVAKAAAEGDTFQWRISIAEVSSEGPFSKFAGYRRWIAVIEGHGMELQDANGGTMFLKPFQPYAFEGTEEIHGVLPSGPVSDLNLIFQPGTVRGSLEFSDEARQLHSGQNRSVLAINVTPQPALVRTTGETVELAYLDGVLATGGAVLELPADRRCAVIELEMLNSRSA